ncbi:MAG: amidophosphoribosyltransferase [Gammaproteobacteria bacterium]|nr:amidophosphoribosyltransferase [Gammaproteobacteria bacterium]NNF62068.1 amidophosphoribosyltransferase [Gammaproteobacteria bacterium]NNM20679.1 amidophosphoribosyltransferase [Gammaproteobacteria bacterium]
MCGIAGLVAEGPVNQAIYDALTVFQHRGQDAAGICTADGAQLHTRRRNGLVRDVFRTRHMIGLSGSMGIGHVRYPTAGGASASEAQPFYVNSPFGICLAHNGNLTNARELAGKLSREDLRHLNTGSDSEVLLNVLAHELQERCTGPLQPADVFSAVRRLHERCRGGYAVVAMVVGYGVVAFRDPHGIRPLVLGRRLVDSGAEYMVASESVVLDVLGFELLRDVRPGEAIFIDSDRQLHTEQCAEVTRHTPCIFEFVYFARPDSIMENISVYKARLRMGEKLADQILRDWPDHDIDVVVPVPDTSRTAAVTVAHRLGVKNREGFIKNRYIGRTFIMPGQQERKKSVRRKLNAIELEFRDKNVLLVDDSIVRGTTSQQIIEMAREAGARNVYFASAAPPVRFPNVYGIDMPSASELIAHDRSVQQVADLIGADRLIYQELDDLIDAVMYEHAHIREFDTSCFSGKYVTGDVSEPYLARLERERSDGAKAARESGRGGLRSAARSF